MKIVQRLLQAALFTLLIIPLVGADSCSGAVKTAEDDETSSTGVAAGTTGHADKLPVLPEGEEGQEILQGGGPEVISIPPASE